MCLVLPWSLGPGTVLDAASGASSTSPMLQICKETYSAVFPNLLLFQCFWKDLDTASLGDVVRH